MEQQAVRHRRNTAREDDRSAVRQVKRAGNILIAGMLLSLAYYWWLEPKQFGGNGTYNIIAYWIPIVLSIATIWAWLGHGILHAFRTPAVSGSQRVMVVILILLMGIAGGFFTYGLLFRVVWDRVNAAYVTRQPVEHVFGDVHSVSTGRSSGIYIKVKGYSTSIDAPYSLLKANETRDRERFLVDLQLRPGLLDTWIVEDWKLVDKP